MFVLNNGHAAERSGANCLGCSRIFEYKNSIRILVVLFEYLKLFEYSNIWIEPYYSLQYRLKAHAKFVLAV